MEIWQWADPVRHLEFWSELGTGVQTAVSLLLYQPKVITIGPLKMLTTDLDVIVCARVDR